MVAKHICNLNILYKYDIYNIYVLYMICSLCSSTCLHALFQGMTLSRMPCEMQSVDEGAAVRLRSAQRGAAYSPQSQGDLT